MIYYVRRLNSHIASAETFNLAVTSTSTIKCGTLCSISNGYLTAQRNLTKADYLTLEGKDSTDGKTSVCCIRLAPEMVLKATTLDSISDYKIGDNCSFAPDNDENMTHVELSGNEAEVIGIDGKYVTFILK